MNHFFVRPEQVLPEGIRISGDDFNHIRNVLRMKPGEELAVSDGSDSRYICEIAEYQDEEVLLRIVDIEGKSTELPAEILLFQGIPKGDKLEWIVQKSVELGVHRIIPTAMSRCIARIDRKKEEQKIARLQKIAESAAKQSGRDRIPEISGVMSIKEAADYAFSVCSPVIFAYEKAENPAESRQVFASLCAGQRIALFVGPEGGFSTEEAELLISCGAETVTLGKRILRTETAPLYLLSVIGYELEGRN